MPEKENTPHDDRGSAGKTRTWWHPLLVNLLRWRLAPAYDVHGEVNVGEMPLRLDILLVERESGEVSDEARRELASLLRLFNLYTLIEFKAPTASLERGDLDRLVACAHLYRAQHAESLPARDLTLVVLAPAKTVAFEEDVRSAGWFLQPRDRGLSEIDGPCFPTFLLETDALAGAAEPLVTLVSRVLLRERARIIDRLTRGGALDLVGFTMQQIAQFNTLREDFAMQHTETQSMDEFWAETLAAIPVEQLLVGGVRKRFLDSLTPEEIARDLTPEKKAALREFLDAERSGNGDE